MPQPRTAEAVAQSGGGPWAVQERIGFVSVRVNVPGIREIQRGLPGSSCEARVARAVVLPG